MESPLIDDGADGRVIAPMDLDGNPDAWVERGLLSLPIGRPRRRHLTNIR
jgi:hypothetical protein